jgi:hypothetical protein
MGRGAHDVLVRLGEVAAVLILLLGFCFWRLTQGPIELDRLVPYVQDAFDQSGAPLRVAISGVRFGLDKTTHELNLWVEGVRVSLPDGEAVANFPEMATSFSLGSLLRGRLAPTAIVVEHPLLRLRRDQTGGVKFSFDGPDTGAAEFGPELLSQLTGPPRPDEPFGLLRRIMVRDATVVVDDQRTGRRWQASRVDAALQRNEEGLDGDMSLAIPVGSAMPEFHLSYRYAARPNALDVGLAVDGLDPGGLAGLSSSLEALSRFHFPVSGTLETRLDLDHGSFEGVRLDLGFGTGDVQSDLLPTGAVTIGQGELHAVYAPERSRLDIERLAFDLGGGSRLAFDGSLDGLTPDMILGIAPPPASLPGKLGIVLSDLPVAKFETLWPRWLSRGSRRWVLANIRDGAVDEAAVQLDLNADLASRNAAVVGAHGTLRYHDLTVTYLKGLPPVRKVNGTATLADRQLSFTPASGVVNGQQIVGAALRIAELGAPLEWLTIDVDTVGPVRDALEIIDAKPLHYAHAVGIDPAEVGGRAETALHFRLPLLDELKLDAIEYSARANITGGSLANAGLNRALSDGNFVIEISRTGAHLQGNARFDGIPSAIDAAWPFAPKDAVHARYRVALTLGDDERRRLNFDFLPGRVSGPVGLDATYSVLGDGRAEAMVALDLRQAAVSVAEAGWKKPTDTAATARLVVQFARDRVVGLPEIDIRAPGLDGSVAVALAADGAGIERVDVRRLVIGPNDVQGSVARRAEGGWRVEVRGPRLDLSDAVKSAGKDDSPLPRMPLVIDAQLGQLMLSPGREVRNLSAQLMHEGSYWQAARVDARYPNGHRARLRFGGEAGGGLGLVVGTDDLGATLHLLGISDGVVGGRATVRGHVAESAGKRVLHGELQASDYHLVRVAGLARLLAMASFDSLVSQLSGTGIPFSTLRVNFGYADKQFVVNDLVAYGDAAGITANGRFDLGQDEIDMQGTLVPAYMLNSIIGNVPLIGQLLLGGEGQGLIAANYHVAGSGSDPKVTINPLTALAPGFLRRLFTPNFGLPPPPAGSSPEPGAAPGAR